MDLNNTVFILGAGASKPYNYPTASELREDIITKHRDILDDSLRNAGLNDEDIKLNIRKNFYSIIEQFEASNIVSIDLFLTRVKDKINIELGITLIWLFILHYETNSRIIDANQDWYRAFYNELTGDILTVTELKSTVKQPINFITFNYDRSLEHFFYSSLKNSFGLSEEEAKDLFHHLFKINHVYGKVLYLDWENQSPAAAYQNRDHIFKYYSKSSEMIKLIYSDRKIDEEVKHLIRKANKIFCLGFGFAKANLDFLNFSSLLNRDKTIFATGIKLYPQKIGLIKNEIQKNNPKKFAINSSQIHIDPLNCLELLQKYLF